MIRQGSSPFVPTRTRTLTATWVRTGRSGGWNANQHDNMWYQHARIHLNNVGVLASWQSPVSTAIRNWNNSRAHVYFVTTNALSNSVITTPSDSNNLGWVESTEASTNNSQTIAFRIILNTKRINEVAQSNTIGLSSTDVARGVMLHELGHVVGLKDNPGGTEPSVMRTVTNTLALTAPTQHDINNVNSLYR